MHLFLDGAFGGIGEFTAHPRSIHLDAEVGHLQSELQALSRGTFRHLFSLLVLP